MAYSPLEYYGDMKNMGRFLRYALGQAGDRPLAEVPFAQLAAEWSNASGVVVHVQEKRGTDGMGSITQVIENGFNAAKYSGGKAKNPMRVSLN